jgi:hypothetical protein
MNEQLNNDSTFEEGGWGWPALAKRAHYFDPGQGTSICGRWMFIGFRTRDNGVCGPDDCAACEKKLEKRRKKAAK